MHPTRTVAYNSKKMKRKITYQWILLSFIISCLAGCGLFSKRKPITKKLSQKQIFPQASYEGFHSHPARNLSQNCLEGQYAFTEPQTGIQRCSILPKSTVLRDFGGGYKAYQCRGKVNPLFLKKGHIRRPDGLLIDPKKYRCSNGVAFLKKRKYHTEINCLSEDPYFEPMRGNFTSRFEMTLRSCNNAHGKK